MNQWIENKEEYSKQRDMIGKDDQELKSACI